MNKNQKNNLAMVPMLLLSIATGFDLHAAGHSGNHTAWEIWAVFHTLFSVAFVVLIATHLKLHKAWIKNANLRRRSKGIVVLSAIAIATIATGAVLLAIWDDHSHLGLWHYKIGIAFAILAIIHLIMKRKAIITSIRKRNG